MSPGSLNFRTPQEMTQEWQVAGDLSTDDVLAIVGALPTAKARSLLTERLQAMERRHADLALKADLGAGVPWLEQRIVKFRAARDALPGV
jgi:hypothetical protein